MHFLSNRPRTLWRVDRRGKGCFASGCFASGGFASGGFASGGFAYIGVLILLAILGVVAAAALHLGKIAHRRVAEEALLDVGREISQALSSYRRATPVGEPDAPMELRDLLRDPRIPEMTRHQRRIYEDPMTGKAEWGLLRDEDTKRIVGVYSLANSKPIKIANFSARFRHFVGKTSYQDWVFRASDDVPRQAGPRGATAAAQARSLSGPMDLLDETQGPGETAPRVAPLDPEFAPNFNPKSLISPSELAE